MTATVCNLIFILETFVPGDFPLLEAFLVLVVLISLYPLLKLHKNQRREPRQPVHTAWFKAALDLAKQAAGKVADHQDSVFTSD